MARRPVKKRRCGGCERRKEKLATVLERLRRKRERRSA